MKEVIVEVVIVIKKYIHTHTYSNKQYLYDHSVGRMNSMVYPVDGGMEDWLYAAGWDSNPATLKTCQVRAPTSEVDKRLVHSAPENRALVFLVSDSGYDCWHVCMYLSMND